MTGQEIGTVVRSLFQLEELRKIVDVALTIIAYVLAALFLLIGIAQLARSKEQIVASGMASAADLSPAMIKTIGVLEVLAAAGLVLPALLNIVPILVPLAAVGVVLLMIGATVFHARRKEFALIGFSASVLALAAVVAVGRFGPYQFST